MYDTKIYLKREEKKVRNMKYLKKNGITKFII